MEFQEKVMETGKQEIPILFKNKADCCGCGACLNICPQKAISMREDEAGFLYPEIHETLCIGCGRCKRVCAFQNAEVANKPLKTYAAAATNRDMVQKSASGGVFAALALHVIKCGGVVFGAAFQEDWSVHHVGIEKTNQLFKLQGSKYTQSNTETTYMQVQQYLKEGRKVLYSGTPCQIAGLYGYLGKDYENLLTADLVCHGVPNNRMFQEYINLLEKKTGGKVISFSFRDKTIGWGINGSAVIEKRGENCKKKLWQSASSYLYYFSKGWIYRENCYQCKYACSRRPADLTLGDYWGIEKAHPEYLGKGGWDESSGISVVIANNQRGLSALKEIRSFVEMKPSSFQKAALKNAQLKYPSVSGCREEVLQQYVLGGWDALEERFNKKIGWRKYSGMVKALIPAVVKRKLKSF